MSVLPGYEPDEATTDAIAKCEKAARAFEWTLDALAAELLRLGAERKVPTPMRDRGYYMDPVTVAEFMTRDMRVRFSRQEDGLHLFIHERGGLPYI